MIKKISFSVLLLASVLMISVSCEKYLDVNKNVDAPAYVDGYLYLAGIEQAYQGMYYDLRATCGLTQMMGTSSTFSNFATHYYIGGTDNGGEMWRFVYWLQGMNLENMINQSIKNQEWTLAGIGMAIKAFSWDQMSKYHGELILRDAFVPGLLSHRYDYQDTTFTAVRNWAYKAVEYLEMTDSHDYGSKISGNDYIYAGDKAKWIKFAYGVIVHNLAALTNKSNFTTEYAQELIDCAAKSLTDFNDDAALKVGGGGSAAAQAAYNNFWGTFRGNLTRSYWQHEYAVQVFTGTVPFYDEATGNKTPVAGNPYYPFQLAAKQIICDTVLSLTGHFDPRVAVKLGTIDDPTYDFMDNIPAIKKRKYYGGATSSFTGPIGAAPSFYGRNDVSKYSGTVHDGTGRWIYTDDAPYILMTCAEIKFCLAEAYWKMGMKTEAFEAFKAGVRADIDFTAKYIKPGTKGQSVGGDKITKATFTTLANQYISGLFVDGLPPADFSLSHIMMQKWVALYPWGACEAWVDLRKYHYDLKYTGDYPSENNGWDLSTVDQKWDTDPTRVFKGFFLLPAEVQGRRSAFNTFNQGAPCYRIRPRYNSEYMWNKPSLSKLEPISGIADNYQCSIPWFAYPAEMPVSTK